MSNRSVLIVGGGASGRVAAHKASQIRDVFSHVTLASRTLEKPRRIKEEIKYLQGRDIKIAQVDAENTGELVQLINRMSPKPDALIHVALPYQNFQIMDACLETGVHYIDTATPEVRNKPGFSYKGQWLYNDRFKERGLIGLLGCGFDPGVTSVYVAYAKKHFLDKIEFLDILDCNAGNHGQEFATNFDTEINIREITLPPRHFDRLKGDEWVQTASIISPDAVHFTFDFPVAGNREAYLLYHEELESLRMHFPEIERGRFWMTFGEKYISYLRAFCEYGVNQAQTVEFQSNKVSPLEMLEKIGGRKLMEDRNTMEMFERIGLLSPNKIEFEGRDVAPVVMLASVLPKPETLGSGYTGKTAIGNVMRGTFNGNQRSVYIYSVGDHAKCYQEVGSQGISYTAAVPAVIGAKMIMTGEWKERGVFNLEQLNPDPFMRDMDEHGLSWEVEEFDRKFINDSEFYSRIRKA